MNTSSTVREQLGVIAQRIPEQLRETVQQDPVIGVNIMTLQQGGGVTISGVSGDEAPQVDTQLAMVRALLSNLSETEQNDRVHFLLRKALRLCECAYDIKSGEIRSNMLH